VCGRYNGTWQWWLALVAGVGEGRLDCEETVGVNDVVVKATF